MAMRWRTYSSEFKSIKVPVPPYIEQCQIADYLDSKCEMLDKTIADRNKAIEKLQEYKKIPHLRGCHRKKGGVAHV